MTKANLTSKNKWAFWFRWTLAVLTGIIISVMISGYRARDAAIQGCVRNSEFKSLIADFLDSSAEFRMQAGETGAAQQSNSLANATRLTIPYSDDLKPGEKRGQIASKRIQGCHDVFPAPIPFIE